MLASLVGGALGAFGFACTVVASHLSGDRVYELVSRPHRYDGDIVRHAYSERLVVSHRAGVRVFVATDEAVTKFTRHGDIGAAELRRYMRICTQSAELKWLREAAPRFFAAEHGAWTPRPGARPTSADPAVMAFVRCSYDVYELSPRRPADPCDTGRHSLLIPALVALLASLLGVTMLHAMRTVVRTLLAALPFWVKPSGNQLDSLLAACIVARTTSPVAPPKLAAQAVPQGLGPTPDAQPADDAIALDSDERPSCLDASKLGAVAIDTPLLDVPVTGGVYPAMPFDNPFDSLMAVHIVASEWGIVIKLPGAVSLDSDTGQITTTFDDNPQLPFSRLHVNFKSGPRAPLALPNRCGTYTTYAELSGWNGRTVSEDSSFSLSENAKGQPCPAKLSPGFSAGTESDSAGAPSSFLMRLARDDEDQTLNALTVQLPRGLTVGLVDAEQCADTHAPADQCPAGSQIGDVTVGAGAGSNPFFITNGKAYPTGPYKGAPFGVAIVVPAVAGPFDLGTVTVRSALFVDKQDATVRIVSDPFPTILQGIPLYVCDVHGDVNAPGGLLNPTSGAEKRMAGKISSVEGMSADVSDPFQAADCASLGFKPRMVMRVGGRGRTSRGKTSPLSETHDAAEKTGEPEIRAGDPAEDDQRTVEHDQRRVHARGVRQRHLQVRAREGGTAVAVTPLLTAPLRGDRVLRQERAPDPGSVRGAARPGRLRPGGTDHDP